MYWLVNVLVRDGILLLRALEPMHGIAKMQERRKKSALRELCSGPGKLGQALGFSGADHGVDFTKGAFRVGKKARVTTDVRIGISKATELPWRFLEKESPWISVGQQIGKP
jgi:DNA-3-methyladenine glycosylase